MIYTNSEGVKMDTAQIEKHHLVNALIKNAQLTAKPDKTAEELQTARDNVAALKGEILTRLK